MHQIVQLTCKVTITSPKTLGGFAETAKRTNLIVPHMRSMTKMTGTRDSFPLPCKAIWTDCDDMRCILSLTWILGKQSVKTILK